MCVNTLSDLRFIEPILGSCKIIIIFFLQSVLMVLNLILFCTFARDFEANRGNLFDLVPLFESSNETY